MFERLLIMKMSTCTSCGIAQKHQHPCLRCGFVYPEKLRYQVFFRTFFFFLSASMCLVIVVLAGLFPPLHYSGLIVLTGRQAHNQLHKSLWSVVCLYYLFSVLYNISPPPKCSPSPLNIRTHTAHTPHTQTANTHTPHTSSP